MPSDGKEEAGERDVDSAGVYFMSVDDFEWRPKRGTRKDRDEEDRCGRSAVADASAPGTPDGRKG